MIPVDDNIAAPPTPKELLSILKDTVRSLVVDEVTGEMEPERIWVLRQTRKSDLYWRGIQYISPYLFDSGFVDFSDVGSPIAGAGDKDGAGLYDYNQNIYRGYGRKFVAVLGQRSPNVKAVADDPENDQAKRQTRLADNAAAILRAKWDVDVRNMELSMYLWKCGTAFAYTPYVKNGRKYGTSSEPKMEARQVATGPATYHCANCGADTPVNNVDPVPPACPQCRNPLAPEDYRDPETTSSPVVTGTVQYENGSVELELLNSMFVCVPFYTKDLDDAPWLSYDYEVHKGKLLQRYPELRDRNAEGQGADSVSGGSAQLTREAASSPLGIPVPHRASRWNYRRVWLRPEMYECVVDDAKRQMLTESFPHGMKATLVQGNVVELEDEDLSDVWAACKPETSEFLHADGIGFDLLPVQDLVNDCLVNIPAETIERGLSVTLADPRVFDTDQWDQKTAKAAEMIPAMPAVGESLGDSFFQLPPSSFSQQIEPWGQLMQTMGMQNVGIVPEIFGGGNASTARQAEINKNAALMQLGTTWLYCRKFWEKTYHNGVKQLARWGAGMLKHNGLAVDLAELQDSGYHFESDEAMPMTWAQQRDFVMWLMEKPPELLAAYGVTHPMNVRENQALLGMTGYYTPNLDLYEKILEVIQQLAQGTPIQKPAEDGSVDVLPSIEPDEFEDDHAFVVQVVQAWACQLSGRRLRESSPDGYANVIAYGKASAKLAAPPPQPTPPPKVTLSGKLPLDAGQAAAILKQEGIDTPEPQGPIANAHGQLPIPPMPPEQGGPMGPMGPPPPPLAPPNFEAPPQS